MPSVTLVPSGYEGLSNMSINSSYPISRGYTNADSTNYTRFDVTASRTGEVYFTFDVSDIPSGATITSVSANGKARVSSTTRITNTQMRFYSGTTAKGSNRTFASTQASKQTITVGSWTRAELNNLRLKIGGTASSSSSSKRIDFYGADITITYTAETVHVTGVSLDKSTDTVEAGETITLTETVAPSNATDQSVTWSTSNASIATVSNGVVTGVSQGTARITVTTTDGGYTDYGGSRILQGVQATVSGGKLTITGAIKDKTLFDCIRYTSGNDNTITVSKDNKYLYCDNANGLRMNAPATLDRFWHYRDHKFWQFKSTASDGYNDASSEYKYYLELNSQNNFTNNHVDMTSIADSTLPEIYIFTESTGDNDSLYTKDNGVWVEVVEAYKKVNGSWVLQSDLSNVFDPNINYVKG